ncbi:MAG: Dabb family protein [Phycisphaerae bacterium]|nr:Dabb family protein [Phycisphaerae bacterium]
MSTFVHAVFFTCKPSATPEQIKLLASDCRSMLTQIPSVRQLVAGRREESMTRPVNDTAYHVGLVVHFDDLSGYRLYADHPLHMEFVAKHKAFWADLRVCDFVAG